MTLKEYIRAVKTLCVEVHTEDMDSWETELLDKRIVLAANMGARDIARSTFPLFATAAVSGPAEWTAPAEYLRLKEWSGGKAERLIGEDGRDRLHCKDAAEYRINYYRTHKKMERAEDVFEFPEDVMNALIYYGAYHVLSADNDKRGFVYYKNLYDQECVNIIANRPGRMTVMKSKRGGMHVV